MKVSIIFNEKVADSKAGYLSEVDDICELNNLNEFAELLTLVHVAPAIFTNNKKRQDHFIQTEFVCLDFDDGKISSKDIHDKLVSQHLNHVIAGSKNYMVDKGDGKGEIERFHVFIPTDTPITSVELYKFICRRFAEINYWKPDKNCMEASRYFYKHSCILFEGNRWENLKVETYIKLREIDERKRRLMEERLQFFTTENELNSMESFKNTKAYEELTSGVLKVDGKRYEASSHILGVMKACGVSGCDAMALIDEHSVYGSGFTRKSVERRIKDFGL